VLVLQLMMMSMVAVLLLLHELSKEAELTEHFFYLQQLVSGSASRQAGPLSGSIGEVP